MKKETINLIIVILLVLTLILLSYNAYLVKTKGFVCLQNPLSYGAKQYSELYNFYPFGRVHGITDKGGIEITFNDTSTVIKMTNQIN